MRVEGFRAVDDERGEGFVEREKESFAEARADVADCFIGVTCGVMASEEEGAEDGGAFTFAMVGAEDDEVETVAYAGEIVFFDLVGVSWAFLL